MLKEKEEELLRYQITEEYLIDRVNNGETDRRKVLNTVQGNIEEIKKQIDFWKR